MFMSDPIKYSTNVFKFSIKPRQNYEGTKHNNAYCITNGGFFKNNNTTYERIFII